MLLETCSCFSFTGTQGLMAASSQLSEALSPLGLNPSETARGISSDRCWYKASSYRDSKVDISLLIEFGLLILSSACRKNKNSNQCPESEQGAQSSLRDAKSMNDFFCRWHKYHLKFTSLIFLTNKDWKHSNKYELLEQMFQDKSISCVYHYVNEH